MKTTRAPLTTLTEALYALSQVDGQSNYIQGVKNRVSEQYKRKYKIKKDKNLLQYLTPSEQEKYLSLI